MKTAILFFSLLVPPIAHAQIVELEAETNHSTLEFFVDISEGITKISGKFTDYKIKLHFADSSLLKSQIEVTINPGSINTGIPGRDEDLKSDDFFDVEKYPEVVFTSDTIIKEGDHYLISGDCTLHGITRKIEIPFTVTDVRPNYIMGFSGIFHIKRSDYNVGTTWKHTTDDHFIADDIEVHIDFWTRKPRKSVN